MSRLPVHLAGDRGWSRCGHVRNNSGWTVSADLDDVTCKLCLYYATGCNHRPEQPIPRIFCCADCDYRTTSEGGKSHHALVAHDRMPLGTTPSNAPVNAVGTGRSTSE